MHCYNLPLFRRFYNVRAEDLDGTESMTEVSSFLFRAAVNSALI